MNAYKLWKDNEITAVQAIKKAGVSKSTFYRKIKEIEKDRSDEFEEPVL